MHIISVYINTVLLPVKVLGGNNGYKGKQSDAFRQTSDTLNDSVSGRQDRKTSDALGQTSDAFRNAPRFSDHVQYLPTSSDIDRLSTKLTELYLR